MHTVETVTVTLNGKERKRKQVTCPDMRGKTTIMNDRTPCVGCGQMFNLYGQKITG